MIYIRPQRASNSAFQGNMYNPFIPSPTLTHMDFPFILVNSEDVGGVNRPNGESQKASEKPTEHTGPMKNNQSENIPKESKVKYVNPEMYVAEEEDQVVFSFDVPGVKADSISLQVKDAVLALEATKRRNTENVTLVYKKSLLLDERQVDASSVENASLNDGVLSVIVPKKKFPEPMNIKVLSSDPFANDSDKADKFKTWSLDLPGVKLADLVVKLDKDKLVVEAERKKNGGRTVHYRETYALDTNCFDVSKLEAFLVDGVLTFAMPLVGSRVDSNSKSIAVSPASSVGASKEPGGAQEVTTKAEKEAAEEEKEDDIVLVKKDE